MSAPLAALEAFDCMPPVVNTSGSMTVDVEDFNFDYFDDYFLWNSVSLEGVTYYGRIENASTEPLISTEFLLDDTAFAQDPITLSPCDSQALRSGNNSTFSPHYPTNWTKPLPLSISQGSPRVKKQSLACPFYQFKPGKYRTCWRYDLKRIEDVRQHIFREHAGPEFYCARCYKILADAVSRDTHIREGSCSIRGDHEFEGTTDGQREELRKPCEGKEVAEQWYHMWDILFPGQPLPKSPYVGINREEMDPTQPDLDLYSRNSINLQAGQAEATVDPAELITLCKAPESGDNVRVVHCRPRPECWELLDAPADFNNASNTAQNDGSSGSASNSKFELDLENVSNAQAIDIFMAKPQTQSSRKRKAKYGSTLPWSKRPSKLPLAAVTILDDWITAHKNDPYPTPAEFDHLVDQTGLTRKQVKTWLNNARARKLQHTPMETYITSSSDDEVASVEDIRRAAESMPSSFPDFSSFNQQRKGKAASASGSSAGPAFDQCPEARWAWPAKRGRKKHVRHRPYANSCARSASSAGSMVSLESAHSVDHHFGKMASPHGAGSLKSPKSLFQCTFCKIEIGEKSWKRHEESQHYNIREWMCMPNNSSVIWSHPTFGSCVFCGRSAPDHVTGIHSCHRIHECLARPKEERMFQRRDKFVQHVSQFHGTMLDESVIEAWESKGNDQIWKCGFCGMLFITWDSRATHIARHFRDGKTMDDWDSGPNLIVVRLRNPPTLHSKVGEGRQYAKNSNTPIFYPETPPSITQRAQCHPTPLKSRLILLLLALQWMLIHV